ncbi:AfsA-related hotdog domain-containing protein [Fertoeibacter niger]|uniref:AfsA-related hotdog domain-containing protein n=1 Tax=Fertoeibacter niger TaxID=2656921 RepID=UPI00128E54B9|nr:AfsA-related hotdog domain-containing protein [Fertoeibacter niger]
MSALDRRMDSRNDVLAYSATDPAHVARLIVDKAHPFFFDHPLDHVPGLLLLEAAVQAAQNRAQKPCFVSMIKAEFIQYTTFDTPILVETQDDAVNGQPICRVEISQNGTPRARCDVQLTPLVSPMPRPHPALHRAERALPPCASQPLNKLRPENVLISTPVITDTFVEARLLPMSRSCLLAETVKTVHPLYLLEAFMQVQRYLNATQEGDRRIRDILTGVSIMQTAPLADLSEGVYLRSAREFVPSGRSHMSRNAWLYAGQKPFAKCAIETARLSIRAAASKGAT